MNYTRVCALNTVTSKQEERSVERKWRGSLLDRSKSGFKYGISLRPTQRHNHTPPEKTQFGLAPSFYSCFERERQRECAVYQTQALVLLAIEKSELISGMQWKALGGGIYRRHEAAQEKKNINNAEARGFEVSLSQYFDSKTKFKLLILYLALLVIILFLFFAFWISIKLHTFTVVR